MLDYIVVGQGLAGSILADHLIERGLKIKIIADEVRPTSSQVAGGMFNPITGKYLAKTWLADELFPYLENYYSNLEKKFNDSFFHPIGVYRPFNNEENKKNFLKQIEKHQLENWIELKEEGLGGIFIPRAGWLNVVKMLTHFKAYFKKMDIMFEEVFNHSKLEISTEFVKYRDATARNIIFAEGYYVKDNPYFNILPFNPVKGEILEGKCEAYQNSFILNQNKWIIPIGENNIRIGATYSWHELDFFASRKGRMELETGFRKLSECKIDLYSHKAGVRPATSDRKPIIGAHPVHKNLFIFNGLGTKGVSLAPFLAFQMASSLKNNKQLNEEINIARFYSLYS